MAVLALVAGPAIPAFAEIVEISTPSTSLVLDVNKGKKLKHLYYGCLLYTSPSPRDRG